MFKRVIISLVLGGAGLSYPYTANTSKSTPMSVKQHAEYTEHLNSGGYELDDFEKCEIGLIKGQVCEELE